MKDTLKYIDRLTNNQCPVNEMMQKVFLGTKRYLNLAESGIEKDELHYTDESKQALALIILALNEEQIVCIKECKTGRRG